MENSVCDFISLSDVDGINKLSYLKRRSCEAAQPKFWKWAGETGENAQKSWFSTLIKDDRFICLKIERANNLLGFIVGKVVEPPEVYAPGGKTLVIDDFCVADDDWGSVGQALLDSIKLKAIEKGVDQLVVVSGAHDKKKQSFLVSCGLAVASNWYVGEV